MKKLEGENKGYEMGSIYKAVSDPSKAEALISFYPHFKVLFKLAQLSMMLTKQTSLENKVQTAKNEYNSTTIKLASQEKIVDNLAGF